MIKSIQGSVPGRKIVAEGGDVNAVTSKKRLAVPEFVVSDFG